MIRKLQAPRRIKHFLWKVLSECVATCSRLTDRHCGTGRSCPRCGDGEESLNGHSPTFHQFRVLSGDNLFMRILITYFSVQSRMEPLIIFLLGSLGSYGFYGKRGTRKSSMASKFSSRYRTTCNPGGRELAGGTSNREEGYYCRFLSFEQQKPGERVTITNMPSGCILGDKFDSFWRRF